MPVESPQNNNAFLNINNKNSMLTIKYIYSSIHKQIWELLNNNN